ncbi:MAG: signal transduction protein [Hydrogenophilales bacterium 16-64-46]|nr:MAG: signal transduction protein [Hydrogenophilales bacterium 12-64-13]OYZ05629.1 MAG: signal transduction protein [Hydrogenophilales bacterium 16-64-46]OZA40208.1 MAG: signal transduction protein [Hydrogenophilales bacterium 17-64-34]HQT00756.1 HDOD domain-containing protein [Thiobacillus sp.]
MISDDPHPSRIVGGGINTGDSEQPVVVTQMLGVGSGSPTREEDLRARFLSFDPLFDRHANLVAHQLVLRGQIAPVDAPQELKQMDEDMLLTGLYSLVQGGVTGSLPLFVEIGSDILFSDVLAELNHPRVVWRVDIRDEHQLARALALQDAGMNFCPALNPAHPLVRDSASAWRYLACRADCSPPASPVQLVVEGVASTSQINWPANAWFKQAALPSEPELAARSQDKAMQLDLLRIALGQSVDMLISFFRLNPKMAPRLLAIANSTAGGLSRPAESAAHALVMLGSQRASRVAALLALAGTHPDQTARHHVVTALTRALFMGKVVRLGAPAESAASAFEIGLLSIAAHTLALPPESLTRTLGMSDAAGRALTGKPSPETDLLRLVHACEINDADTLAAYSGKLGIPLHQISVSYLDALIAASALDTALL